MVRIVFRCMNAALLLLIILSPAGAKPMNFYVSPNGNDSWSGRLASPNRTRTDGPFATLERARLFRYLPSLHKQEVTVRRGHSGAVGQGKP